MICETMYMPVSVLYALFAGTSLVSGMTLFVLFSLYRELRKGPGQLILGQCFAQILLDCHWFTYFFCPVPLTLCKVLGGVSFFAYSLAFAYAVMVCWVVSKHFYEPYIPNTYNCMYHGVCVFSAGVITLIVGTTDGLGPSVMGTCFTRSGRSGE